MATLESTVTDLQARVTALEQDIVQLTELIGQLQAGDNPAAGAVLSGGSIEADPELTDLIARNKKIAAIKRYRELTGAGLMEAKSAVEELAER